MAKASKDKSFIRQLVGLLLVFFITELESVFLILAIFLAGFLGMVLASSYFAHRYVPFSYYFMYFIFFFLVLLWVAFDIRRVGVKQFLHSIFFYNALYIGTVGKYYKWFVFILIFMCMLTALVILVGLFTK